MQLGRWKFEGGCYGTIHCIVYLVCAGTIQTELLLGQREKAREAWIDGWTLADNLYGKEPATCHMIKTFYNILEQTSTCKVRLEDSMQDIKDSVARDEVELNNISCSV